MPRTDLLPRQLLLSLLLICLCGTAGFGQPVASSLPDPPLDDDAYQQWVTEHKSRFAAALKEVEKELKSSTNKAQLYYQKGAILLGLEDYAKALVAFQKHAETTPKDEVWFQMARCNHHLGQYRTAITQYQKFSALRPADPTPLIEIVDILFAADEKGQAIKLSDQIAKMFPESKAAQVNLASTYQRTDKPLAAIKVYQEMMKKWSADTEQLQTLVSLYMRVNRLDDAVALAENAVKRFPQSASAWEALGTAYQYQEKLTEAFTAYETAQKWQRQPTTMLASFYNLGYAAFRARRFELATQCYQRVLQMDPLAADALFRLGRIHILTNKKQEAEETQKLLKKQDGDLARQLAKEISQPALIEQEYANVCASAAAEEEETAIRPVILYKEKALYSDLARSERVQGTILLSAIFTADGRVTGLRIVRGLPYGLNEEATKAAKKIRFKPACRNGKPVSVRMSMEYSFNLM